MNDARIRGQALLPIFRTPTQGSILATLLLDTSLEASIADLARAAGVAPPNALREVNQLIRAGVLQDRRVGRARLVRADTASPFVAPLTQILSRTHGPVQAVRDALSRVPSIERAVIVGSWAERALGHPGHAPRDLDVVVVGDPPTRELRRINAGLEDTLGMPVQITVLSSAEWRDAHTGFVQAVQARPSITVVERTDEELTA